MNEKQIAAMRMGLEALEDTLSGDLTPYQAAKTIAVLRAALADQALDKMVENERELGIQMEVIDPDSRTISVYEQPAQQLIDPCKCGKQTIAWCMANTCSKAEQPAYRAVKTFHGGKPHYVAEQPAQQEPVAGEPLPCPFCGHVGLDFSDGSTYRWGHASCGGCGATCGEVRREYPDKGEWHSEAIAEWNRRYTRPQAREPLKPERFNHMLELFVVPPHHVEMVVRAIEAAHGITSDAATLGEKK